MDIKNITDYFRKKSVSTLSERTCFEFITANMALERHEMDSRISQMMQQAEKEETSAPQTDRQEGERVEDKKLEGEGQMSLEDEQEEKRLEREGEKEVEERVFRQAYIPQNLFEVVDPERDVGIIERGGKNDLIYAKFLNVQETKSQEQHPATENSDLVKGSMATENMEDSGGSDDLDEETDSDEEDEEDEDGQTPRGKRHEDKDAKKERKQKVKEEARERRKNKIPKSAKKRKIKISKGKK
jgi:RIO kinase 1